MMATHPFPTPLPCLARSVGPWPYPGWEGQESEGRWLAQTRAAPPQLSHALPQEPYLQSQCDCCSYSLDPENPVRVLHLRCPDGHAEPVVLPAIRSCQCSACQGGSGRGGAGLGGTGTSAGHLQGRGRAFRKAPGFPKLRPSWDSSFLTPSDPLRFPSWLACWLRLQCSASLGVWSRSQLLPPSSSVSFLAEHP